MSVVRHRGIKFLDSSKHMARPTHGKVGMLFGFYCGVILCNFLSAVVPPESDGLIWLFAFEFPVMFALWLFVWGEDIIDDWLGL